jgi:hypothetical protein
VYDRLRPRVHPYLRMARAARSIASSRVMSSLYPASNTAMALRLPLPIVANGSASVEPCGKICAAEDRQENKMGFHMWGGVSLQQTPQTKGCASLTPAVSVGPPCSSS